MRKPEALLTKVIDTHLAKAYGWKEITGDVVPCVAGNMRVDPAIETVLLNSSGQDGIFVEKLLSPETPRPVVNWVRREPREEFNQYLQRAQNAARAKAKPLAFRRGGSSCFGIVGDTPAEVFSTFVITGLPWFWGPQSVKDWIGQIKWKLSDVPLSPPKNRKQGWIVNLAPPSGIDRDAVHLFVGKTEEDDDFQITLKRWVRSPKKFKELPQGKSSGWVQPQRKKDSEIVETQVDEDEGMGASQSGEKTEKTLKAHPSVLPMLPKVHLRKRKNLGPASLRVSLIFLDLKVLKVSTLVELENVAAWL